MMQNLSERERRLVIALIPALLITAVVYYMTEPTAASAPVVDTGAAIEVARLRLERARINAAQLPARKDAKKALDASLQNWEKRLITADTPAQAQAQLTQIFRRVARAQGPTVEIRSMDIGRIQPANNYAEILMNVTFDCQVEGLVNLLTDLASQPEFLSWSDIRVNSQDSKQKRITVSFTLIGLGPAKLLPKLPNGGRG